MKAGNTPTTQEILDKIDKLIKMAEDCHKKLDKLEKYLIVPELEK